MTMPRDAIKRSMKAIKEVYDADLVLFDENITIKKVFVLDKLVFEN